MRYEKWLEWESLKINCIHVHCLAPHIGLNVYGTHTSIQQRTTCFNKHSLYLQIFVFLVSFVSFFIFLFFEEKLLSMFPFGFIQCYLSCHRSKCHRFISLLCLLFYYLFFSRFIFRTPMILYMYIYFLWLPAVLDPRGLALLPAGLVIDFSFMDS